MHLQEAVRRHDDRLAYLENDHAVLTKRVDVKAATDAEFDDWVINRNDEDWLTILGMKRLPSNLNDREWQDAARRQVSDLIRLVLKTHRVNLEYEVLYVTNPMRDRPGQTVYNVQMSSVFESRRIRDLYSGFFRHNRPVQLPVSLKGVSLRNKVTLSTRVRIAIMQQIGFNYKASNPGSSIRVKGHASRPVITIIPPRTSGGGSARAQTFNFVGAVTTLPVAFTDENLTKIFQVLGGHHPGQLRNLFVVLNDDDRERCQGLVRTAQRSRPSFAASRSGPTPAQSTSGIVSGPGQGMDLNAGFLASLRNPPPPPPPRSPTDRSRSGTPVNVRRSRGASPRPRRSSRSSSRSRSPSVKRSHKTHSKGGLKRRHQSESKERRRKSKRSRRLPSSSSSSSGSGSSHSQSPVRSKKR